MGSKKKAEYVRRWYFEAYFRGEMQIDLPLVMTEEDVRRKIDSIDHHSNWKKETLQRGPKVKIKNAILFRSVHRDH